MIDVLNTSLVLYSRIVKSCLYDWLEMLVYTCNVNYLKYYKLVKKRL